MRRSRGFPGLSLPQCGAAFLLLLSVATHANAGSLRFTTIQSKHYQVYTTADVRDARPVAQHMDLVYDEYARRFRAFRSERQLHMPLYLFATQDEYHTFLRSHDIHGEGTGGIFFIRDNVRGLATWLSDRPMRVTLETLQHEGFHQFAHHHIGARLPLWVNEGLAEYFGDAKMVGGQMRIGFASGRRITAMQDAVNDGKVIDLDELMAMPTGRWQMNLVRNRERGRLQYDQSWSMVHFLIHGDDGRYRQAFERYLTRLSEGHEHAAAFEAAFGANDTAAFRQRWLAFVQSMEPDPLDTAVSRMRFLGQGLLLLRERREPTPRSLDELKRKLTSMGFRAVRIEDGQRTEVHADDATLYTYQQGDSIAVFRLSAPARTDLPPRIIATGLSPQPTLNWRKQRDGTIESVVEYR